MSAGGILSALNSDQPMTHAMNMPASAKPGITPAMKSWAIEVLVCTP